jgi:hypothetical protein
MSRLDYFLIWGNGYHQALEIIDEIRKDENFRIHLIIKKNPKMSTAEFIQKVYACDTVPWEHLVAKSRYLLKHSPQVVMVLVTNKEPDERHFGEGEFRHIQCKKVKDLKEKIRNKYNPRLPDGRRTEEHVIHGSDYESQVDHILKVLGLPNKESFFVRPNPDIETSCYLNPFKYTVQEVPISNMHVSYVGSHKVQVKRSFHYYYVTGNETAKDLYRVYWGQYWGIILLEDHSPQAFDWLIKNFKYTGEKKDLIVVRKEGDGRYTILDGAHRTAILASKGVEKVKVAVAEEIKK